MHIEAISDLIVNSSNLKFLKLKGNKIGDDGVKALCRAMLNSNVHTFDLSYNTITWDGVTYLINLTEANKKIKVLSLKKNSINSKLFNRIASEFKANNVTVEL